MPTKSTPHHHGNLRRALVSAGTELLSEGGRANLSLRKTAARANVSHAAPAHHFDGLDGLLQAIAAAAFLQFTDYMVSARANGQQDAQSQLQSIVRGYLDFAQDHEALFDLIFSEPIKNAKNPELVNASARAFEVLSETCALFHEHPNGPLVNEISIWSSVHGYAILRKFDRLRPHPAAPAIPFDWIMPTLTPKANT